MGRETPSTIRDGGEEQPVCAHHDALCRQVRWAHAMQSHDERLRAYTRSFESDATEAADLVQAAWCIAWELRGANPGQPIDWLFLVGCCRRAAAESEASRRRDRAVFKRLSINQGADDEPGKRGNHDDLCDRAWDCLLTLPMRQREVVIYRIVWGKTEKETATDLHCAVGTVKAHLHRGLAKLHAFATELRASVDGE